jgi:hypothetical protein
MGAMALHGYSSMELKSRSFTSKEPHVAREPQVADPCTSPKMRSKVDDDYENFKILFFISNRDSSKTFN